MFINYEFLRSSILNKILALIFVLIVPNHAYAGFPEGMEMTEDRLEILTDTYPQYYLHMFEKTRKGN